MCGCSKDYKFSKLGYSDEEIAAINTLSEENRDLFLKGYNETLINLVTNKQFKEENLDEYLKFRNDFNDEYLFYLVNENIVNDENFEKILIISKDPYFILEKTSEYLEFYGKYMNLRTLVEAVNSLSCYEQYSKEIAADTSKNYLVLVNKFYTLDKNYEPDDLVEVDKKYTKYSLKLRKECYEAYIRMYEDGLEEGLDLSINSAYRNWQLQYDSYNRFLTIDPQNVVDTYSARPGHSEHQTGLAIDIISEGSNFDTFQYTDEAKWMADNCDKYGFIIRYTDEKKDVTLYKGEAWQVRYVGDEATKIKESGLTFDEYYAYYLEK